MDDLMMRRRMMAPTVENWDYDWKYTDGLLEDHGWTADVLGTAQSEMTADGEQLTSAASSYIRLYAPVRQMTKGVIEVEFNATYARNDQQNFRISLSNGTDGIQVFVSYAGGVSGVKLMDYSTPQASSTIANYTSGDDIKIRLELDGASSNVYINDRFVTSFGVHSIQYTRDTYIMSQNQIDGRTIVKSVKLKVEHL